MFIHQSEIRKNNHVNWRALNTDELTFVGDIKTTVQYIFSICLKRLLSFLRIKMLRCRFYRMFQIGVCFVTITRGWAPAWNHHRTLRERTCIIVIIIHYHTLKLKYIRDSKFWFFFNWPKTFVLELPFSSNHKFSCFFPLLISNS